MCSMYGKWLGSVMAMTRDLCTWMSDRLWAGKESWYGPATQLNSA